MRARGSTTPDPREWSPSPAWPEGRGLFLLRPLLALRREEIREWLAAQGERWIDDPANESPRSARAQARRDLTTRDDARPDPAPDAAIAKGLALACRQDPAAGLHVSRGELSDALPGAAARFLSAACLCAAGTSRPPSRLAVARLAERLGGRDAFAATLSGARIEADGEEVRFLREAGEAARGGLEPLSLAAGQTGIWDGRFEVTADRPLEVCSAAGQRQSLSPADRGVLSLLPASARDTVPIVQRESSPSLATATPLALDRLLAACGVVDVEPA